MTTRDWTKERWRKQYTREPLEEHLGPVMARGLRELLNALAEDDGCLIRDADDPRDALVRALGAQPAELDLVRTAVDVLIASGHLEEDERGVWIPELPVAQAHYRADGVATLMGCGPTRSPAAYQADQSYGADRASGCLRSQRHWAARVYACRTSFIAASSWSTSARS